jgi:WD40 repeat protein
MKTAAIPGLTPLALVTLLVACESESATVAPKLQAMSFANSEWSAPVNLGAAINTPANEQGPSLSNDGLSLYFGSDRDGGSGSFDLWVVHRPCPDCSWETPVNLGATVNTGASETGPSVSDDGHLLFFTSTRAGGQGLSDLYLSHRADPKDDLGWEAPVALGSGVNTPASEAGAEYLQNVEEGQVNFYFNRAPAGATADIYSASLTRDGETLGPAVAVVELNHPTATDQGVSLRKDGKEVFFFSTRPGGLGGADLWTSTRQSAHDAWSAPTNLGAPLNSPASEQQPSLSSDGRTLLFASSRTGGLGGTDLWMSTRTPSGH